MKEIARCWDKDRNKGEVPAEPQTTKRRATEAAGILASFSTSRYTQPLSLSLLYTIDMREA